MQQIDKANSSGIRGRISRAGEICDSPLKANDSKGIFQKSLICILILVLSLHANHTLLVRAAAHPDQTDKYPIANNCLVSISSQELTVDIYTEKAGRGQNVPIGTYRIGDTIKFFVFVSHNCTVEVDLITPNGSIWVHMYGPVNNGTMIDYIDTVSDRKMGVDGQSARGHCNCI